MRPAAGQPPGNNLPATGRTDVVAIPPDRRRTNHMVGEDMVGEG